MKYETEYQSKFKWFDSPVSKQQTREGPSKVADGLSNFNDKTVQANYQLEPKTVSKKLFVDLPEENVQIDKSEHVVASSYNKTTAKMQGPTCKKTKQNGKALKNVKINPPKNKKILKTAALATSKSNKIDQGSDADAIKKTENKTRNVACNTRSSSPRVEQQKQDHGNIFDDKSAHVEQEKNLSKHQSPYYDSVTSSEYKENFGWKFLKREKPVTHPTNDVLPLHAKNGIDEEDRPKVNKDLIKSHQRKHLTNKNCNELERPRPVAERKHTFSPIDSIRPAVSNQSKEIVTESMDKSSKREDNLDLFKSFLDSENSKRPIAKCTEYSANFQSPTKFHVRDGGWIDDVSPQALSCFDERPDCNDWFKEVVRLRQLSYTFKTREQAGSFFKKYMQNKPTIEKRVEIKDSSMTKEKKKECKLRQSFAESVDDECMPMADEETEMVDETTQTPTKRQSKAERKNTDDSPQPVADHAPVAAETSHNNSIVDHDNPKPCENKEDLSRHTVADECISSPVSRQNQVRPVPFSKTIQPLDHYRNYTSNVRFDSKIFPSSTKGLNNSKLSSEKDKRSAQHSFVSSERSVNKDSKLNDKAAAGLKTNNHVSYNIISQRSKDPPSSFAMPVLRKSYNNDNNTRLNFKNDFSSLIISDVDSISSSVGTPPRSMPQKITNYDSLLDTSLSSTSSVANETLRRAINRKTYF